jgi:hypothetical protein
MRSTDTHFIARARQVIAALCITLSLSAQDFSADRDLFAAYQKEDMSVWKEQIDVQRDNVQSTKDLLYEYGYCGYIVAEAKKEGKESLMPAAKSYVAQFRKHVEAQKGHLPIGHYEMYMSAVLVYELRLHESMRPIKAMSLAKEATKLAPNDPLVLSYYGTSLFYAPKPFGSKEEALVWFEKADKFFKGPQWEYCWVREATEMYIQQCHEKLKK